MEKNAIMFFRRTFVLWPRVRPRSPFCSPRVSFSLLLLLIITLSLLWPSLAGATIGDIWDAKAQWSDLNNPNTRIAPPYGVWSYRAANGNLMLRCTTNTIGGGPPGWSDTGDANSPSLFDDNWTPGGAQDADTFAGHGPWQVRWTSPVNGYVKITVTLWQKFEDARRMTCHLAQNGDMPFAGASIPLNPDGTTITGPAGKVTCGPVYRRVNIGDTISLTAVAMGTANTFVVVTCRLEQVDESVVVLPAATLIGDINRDNWVNLDDVIALAEKWLRDDCSVPNFCLGADIDESGFVDLEDFTLLSANYGKYFQFLRNLGFVVVSPAGPLDGADFGGATPGTQSTGLQEAFDYAAGHNRDIFIVGGPVVYQINVPLYIPPAQNWRIAGGDYVINFNQTSGDFIVFDSQINCDFKLSLIVANNVSLGSLVKIYPTAARPDGQVGFSNCRLFINALVGGGDVWGKGLEDGTGIGIHFDALNGPIEYNDIYVLEINACEGGFFLERGVIRNNLIECPFNHITNYPLYVQTGTDNRINSYVDSGGTLNPGMGAYLGGGERNEYNILFGGGFQPASALIFDGTARDNLVYTQPFLNPNAITNYAAAATNRIIPYQPAGFKIPTPAFPASDALLTNSSNYTVLATIASPGVVSSWTFYDVNGLPQTIDNALYHGQLIYLEPGEAVKFTYTSVPDWNWRTWR
jgi:hypothetical protein